MSFPPAPKHHGSPAEGGGGRRPSDQEASASGRRTSRGPRWPGNGVDQRAKGTGAPRAASERVAPAAAGLAGRAACARLHGRGQTPTPPRTAATTAGRQAGRAPAIDAEWPRRLQRLGGEAARARSCARARVVPGPRPNRRQYLSMWPRRGPARGHARPWPRPRR